MPARFHVRTPLRRIIQRFAEVVCPPELRTQRLINPLLDELELYLGALPARHRRSLLALFLAFDQAARFYPPARGRRFVALDDARAEAYFRAAAHGPLPAQRGIVKLLKGIVTMCYYELPAITAQLAYHPDAYIALVARRRIASYADAIRTAHDAVFEDDARPRASEPHGDV